MAALPTVEITSSRRRLGGPAAVCAAGSAFLVWSAAAVPASFAWRILCAVGAAFLALVAVRCARDAGRADRPLLVLTATGVSDHRVAAREIPWLDVIDVIDHRAGHEQYVALLVEEHVWDDCGVRTAQRRARRINRRINVDGLFLNALPTTATHAELLASVLRYWQVAHAAAAR